MKFNIVTGIIETSKLMSFEKILWRISKGNVFLRSADIDFSEESNYDGPKLSMFLIFFQGQELKTRVKKICEGYHSTVYPCPDDKQGRREMLQGVDNRLQDLMMVMNETESHLKHFLTEKCSTLNRESLRIRKMKAVYHCLNMFNFDVTTKAMVAECWIPQFDVPIVKEVLLKGAELAGSAIAPILNEITVDEMPPTYNRTNKYTSGFQHLVDAYGVNSYREVNPAVYTIATFPFLFAVMFGDLGHGFIMFLFGLWLVFREKHLTKMAEESEIFGIFFGGRYIITMMGAFSMYTGLVYNDIFSKSLNIFGSHWAVGDMNFTGKLELTATYGLDPGVRNQYKGDPYYFGVDPIWQGATNKITFLNGYKMKISLIFGLIHMVFGVCLSAWNKALNRKYASIVLQFMPQLIFLLFIFCYLIFLIFFKWVAYYADYDSKDTNTQ